jgi:hypothetical protein
VHELLARAALAVGRPDPGFLEYRQHHLPADPVGSWPPINGVQTDIPEQRRIDGIPEVTFEHPLSSLKALRYNTIVHADERNVFSRTVLNLSTPRRGRWFDTAEGGPTGARTLVMIRRRPGTSTSVFSDAVHDGIGATPAGLPEVGDRHVTCRSTNVPPAEGTPCHDHPHHQRPR